MKAADEIITEEHISRTADEIPDIAEKDTNEAVSSIKETTYV
jgi:hypothetical protein